MAKTIVARWEDWSRTGIEHLVLRQLDTEVIVDSVIIAAAEGTKFGVRYHLVCDAEWCVREAVVSLVGGDRSFHLISDAKGTWREGARVLQQLTGATDIDISATPFTNTLPIRRLRLRQQEPAEILALYVQVPSLELSIDRQRYTLLDQGRRYRYESVDSDFKRDIEVDDDGLVVTYPGLFRRTS